MHEKLASSCYGTPRDWIRSSYSKIAHFYRYNFSVNKTGPVSQSSRRGRSVRQQESFRTRLALWLFFLIPSSSIPPLCSISRILTPSHSLSSSFFLRPCFPASLSFHRSIPLTLALIPHRESGHTKRTRGAQWIT